MKKTIIFLITFICISSIVRSQQDHFSMGGGIGVGSLMGDFPSQTTFGSKLFFETTSLFSVFNKFQFQFTFAQKIEKFLPGTYSYEHYSYFTSMGFSGIFTQPFNSKLYIEEGVGVIYLNDRSFEDINSWNYGILISLLGGLHMGDNIDLSLNVDYGITVNNTNARYFLMLLGLNYGF